MLEKYKDFMNAKSGTSLSSSAGFSIPEFQRSVGAISASMPFLSLPLVSQKRKGTGSQVCAVWMPPDRQASARHFHDRQLRSIIHLAAQIAFSTRPMQSSIVFNCRHCSIKNTKCARPCQDLHNSGLYNIVLAR